MAEKRVRNMNWESEERQLLRQLVKEHVGVLENKSKETSTNKKKATAWEQLSQKFNTLNCRQRDIKQLKVQWKKMKIESKKEFHSYQRESRMTGGGPKPISPSAETVEIMGMIPAGFLCPENPYDSNTDCVEVVPRQGFPQELSKEIFICEDSIVGSFPVEDLASIAAGSCDGAVASTSSTTIAPVTAPPPPPPPPSPITITSPTTTPAVAATATPASSSKFRRGKEKVDFDFKKKSFESMEVFRKREDERLEKEHVMRLKWAEEQHQKIMNILTLQEELLLKQLGKQ